MAQNKQGLGNTHRPGCDAHLHIMCALEVSVARMRLQE